MLYNGYNNCGYQNFTLPPQQMQQPIQQSTIPQYNLNGKIVDGIEMVKATDIPLGGYGVFPKADLSEVYIKSWNNLGQSNVITYKPIIQQDAPLEVDNSQLLSKIESLEEKLDQMAAVMGQTPAASDDKVEGKVDVNAY